MLLQLAHIYAHLYACTYEFMYVERNKFTKNVFMDALTFTHVMYPFAYIYGVLIYLVRT